MNRPDWRLNAFRPDLADAALRGIVEAARFTEGRPARVVAPCGDLKRRPGHDQPVDAQVWRGDTVTLFDEAEGWAWVQNVRDRYVGYMRAADLAPPGPNPTHLVCAPRTFIYPVADMKAPAAGALSMGARVSMVDERETRGTRYVVLDTGEAIVAGHLRRIGERDADHVAVGECLLHTPYLWGGSTAFGADCAGFVQLCLFMTGRTVLRDSDMQAATLGEAIDAGNDWSGLERGDFLFWKGHVGMLSAPDKLMHASGHSMAVTIEPLGEAIARIARLYGPPTGARRLAPER